jgi:hypothetical protein
VEHRRGGGSGPGGLIAVVADPSVSIFASSVASVGVRCESDTDSITGREPCSVTNVFPPPYLVPAELLATTR